MRTLDQIRRSHASARPKHDNPAWLHTHEDLTFVLELLDSTQKEVTQAREYIELLEAERARGDLAALLLVGNRLARGQATPAEWNEAVKAATPAPICVLSRIDEGANQ